MNLELSSPVPQPIPPPPEAAAAMNRVLSVMDSCLQVQSDLENSFQQYFDECHNRCIGTLVDCQACVSGYLQNIIERGQNAGADCATKVQAKIMNLTQSAMSKAAETIQYQPPSLEQASAQISLNNYPTCGPLGCNPAPVQPAPEPIDMTKPLPGFQLDPVAYPPVDAYGQPITTGANSIAYTPPNPVAAQPYPYQPLPPPAGVPITLPPVNCPPGTHYTLAPPPIGPCEANPTAGPPLAPPPAPPVTGGNPPQPSAPPASCPVPSPPVVIPSCPTPPDPAPTPTTGGTAQPPTGVSGQWNSVQCPINQTPKPDSFNGNWFDYLGKVTQFYYYSNPSGPDGLHAPDGFWGHPSNQSATASDIIRWGIAYGTAVCLPAIGATILPVTGSCNLQLSLGDYAVTLLCDFVEKWTGFDLTNIKQSSQYNINYNCPSFLPGQGEADELMRKKIISTDLWKCWTRANNNLDIPAATVRDGSRPRPSIDEAFRLYNLDPNTYGTWYGDAFDFAGFDIKYYAAMNLLQYNIPNVQDCLSWTNRQIEDNSNIQRYGLATNLNLFENDQYVKWLGANGYNSTYLDRIWYAHWQHVPAETAIRMSWRSRPDSQSWPQGVGFVTQSDITYLQNSEGLAPFWQDKLAALARPIPQKRELQLLLESKAMTQDQIIGYLKDSGFTDNLAQAYLAKFTYSIQKAAFAKEHAVTQQQIIGYYVNGTASDAESRAELQSLGIETNIIAQLMSEAEFRRIMKIRQINVKATQTRYKTGEYSDAQAISILNQNGMQVDEAIATVSTWSGAKAAKGKVASAAQLCKWFGQGLLSADDYYLRLVNVGWSKDDANRISGSCAADVKVKIAKTLPKTTRKKTVTVTTKVAPAPAPPATVDTDTTTTINVPLE